MGFAYRRFICAAFSWSSFLPFFFGLQTWQIHIPFGILESGGSQHSIWNPLSQESQKSILSAFLPWILHALQVLHSMHCHLKAFTFVVNSGQNFKQDGCPLLPQSAQERSSSGFFSRFDSLVPKQKLHIGMGSARGWSFSWGRRLTGGSEDGKALGYLGAPLPSKLP